MLQNGLLLLILGILVALTGCMAPGTGSSQDNISPTVYQITNAPLVSPSATSPNQAVSIPGLQFPREPADLNGTLLTPVPFGSFEESFIGTDQCSNASETYTANYDLVSGTDGPHKVRLQLVPVDNMQDRKEIPLPESIISTQIEPAEFDVLPNHLYTVGINITVGPNVTGTSFEFPGGGGMITNPDFPFILHVFIDGEPAPGADDQVSVLKLMLLHTLFPEYAAFAGNRDSGTGNYDACR